MGKPNSSPPSGDLRTMTSAENARELRESKMAELEDVTLDGKPLHSLRVADLKLALEQRRLPKSGQKSALIKRLKGALMLENLQRTSTPHMGLQPNSQIGEEMSQNSFIKQYLAKQQELLRQRLEREAREAAEADESPAGPEEEDHTEGNDSAPYHPDMHRPMPSQPPLTRAEEEGGGGPLMGQGMIARRPDFGSGSVPQESPDGPGGRIQRPSLHQGNEEPTTPSPPRAVASLSVRVLGEPERQGLPPPMPRAQEKEGTAPAEPGSAHSVLHLSRSARAVAGRAQEESDDDDEDDEDDSEEDDEWGPAAGARRGGQAPPQPQQPSPSVPAGRERSRRKLQPPQHIPPQQVHQPPMQLRQPTPPPSPPPELSFPLPDTPKQSPPDMDEPEGAGAGVAARPPPDLQRQDSDSSSRSSSPEPSQQRRPGPLSLLARKMASEGAFGEGRKRGEASSDAQMGPVEAGPGDANKPGAGVGGVLFPGGAIAHIGNSAGHTLVVPEVPAPVSGAQLHPLPLLSVSVPTITLSTVPVTSEPQGHTRDATHQERERDKETEEERQEEKESRLPPWKRGRDLTSPPVSGAAPSQVGSEEPSVDQATNVSSQASKRSRFLRDTPLSSSPPRLDATTTSPPPIVKKPRMFSDTSSGSMVSPTKPEQGSVVVTTQGGLQLSRDTHGPPQSSVGRGVLVSGFQHSDTEVASPNKAPVEKPKPSTGKVDVMECDRQAEKGTPKEEVRKGCSSKASEGDEKKILLEPMGPVLPPSHPGGREAEKKQERGRQGKRASGRQSSTSSDTSSSDSGSSSSRSSRSSSSGGKSRRTAHQKKKACLGRKGDDEEKQRQDKGVKKRQPAREVKQTSLSEPAGPAVMEVDPDSEGSLAQPASEGDPENNEARLEESATPKAFAARKISLTSIKTSPGSAEGGAAEAESGGAAGRKRRWGSSTAVTAKKPSISITTDSLKSLIPDIKPSQEAVVELHPDDVHLSGEEETPARDTRDDQGLDKGLKIRRTVTQVVSGESQENGQREREDEEEEEQKPDRERERTHKEKRKESFSEDVIEIHSPDDADTKKVTPSDTLVRRSISQQKSGVSITIDDPVRTAKQPSPPRGKVSNIVHVCNLVRPFTLGQLKELLNRSGSVVEEGFWIDKIKSHCYVTYSSTEEAVATRAALHGVKWPQSNPKVLSVDFCEQGELDFHRGLLTADRGEEFRGAQPGGPPHVRPGVLPPLMPEQGRDRDRGTGGVRDQWAEREREMERRERTRAEREWDRDKIRDFGKPGEEGRRSQSRDRERRRKERGKSKERKTDKKVDEPPAKLLDDLFQKTKAAPCIYWLPLSEEQALLRVQERADRQKERERRRKEQQEEEDKKREEERKERIKTREKEGGVTANAGGGVGGGASRGTEGDRDREREKGRDRERGGDKRKDGFRPRGPDSRPTGGFGGGRRSRSRSNPRDRRR